MEEEDDNKKKFDFKEFTLIAAILTAFVYVCLLCGFEELTNYWKAIISGIVGLVASACIQIFDPLNKK